MTFIEDWDKKFHKLWSIRLALLTAVFGALEVALPFFTGIVPPGTMAGLASFTAIGSAVARVIAQPKLNGAPTE
jgi:hypothetical protein